MAKLRHIALSVADPEKAADFYCEAFDMERCGKTDSPLARGCYVTDGVITVALLDYKTDEWAGYVEGEDERGADGLAGSDLEVWRDPATIEQVAAPTEAPLEEGLDARLRDAIELAGCSVTAVNRLPRTLPLI